MTNMMKIRIQHCKIIENSDVLKSVTKMDRNKILSILHYLLKKQKSTEARKLLIPRHETGEYEVHLKDLHLFDMELFFRYFRMFLTKFQELIATNADEKLCSTL